MNQKMLTKNQSMNIILIQWLHFYFLNYFLTAKEIQLLLELYQKLAYALTIHKSQGATLKQAVIDLGKCEKTLGLTFVALSRLCNYKDFLIQPFSLERLKKISKF